MVKIVEINKTSITNLFGFSDAERSQEYTQIIVPFYQRSYKRWNSILYSTKSN